MTQDEKLGGSQSFRSYCHLAPRIVVEIRQPGLKLQTQKQSLNAQIDALPYTFNRQKRHCHL